MRTKTGTVLILLGLILLAGAMALYLYNDREDRAAAEASRNLMPQLVESIVLRTEGQQERPNSDSPDSAASGENETPDVAVPPEERVMPVVEVDGHGYIGFLSIPSLGLELPVMADWSYPQLRIAPCRYTGSVRGEDMVVMAHNYDSHFGPISGLQIGDSVLFVDMDGRTIPYQVVGKDVLPPTAVDEMTSGEFDLTLFTCTYGGASRVTVYCNRTDK